MVSELNKEFNDKVDLLCNDIFHSFGISLIKIINKDGSIELMIPKFNYLDYEENFEYKDYLSTLDTDNSKFREKVSKPYNITYIKSRNNRYWEIDYNEHNWDSLQKWLNDYVSEYFEFFDINLNINRKIKNMYISSATIILYNKWVLFDNLYIIE